MLPGASSDEWAHLAGRTASSGPILANGTLYAPQTPVTVGSFSRGWIGHVSAGGVIHLDVDQLRHHVLVGRTERGFHTWVHESLHARQRSSSGRAEESSWSGYEEGLVEGLTRMATGVSAGMAVEDRPYDFYVAAYAALARVIRVDVERLWRSLWRSRPGDVRRRFGDTLAELATTAAPARRLDQRQIMRLKAVGDRVFAATRERDRPSGALLAQLWESAFR